MAIHLRQAEPRDIAAIVGLMNVAFRGTGDDAGWNSESSFIDGDRTSEALLREELSNSPRALFLVWDHPHRAGIQACVKLEPIDATRWYLGSLTIEPLLQNAGLGRLMLEEAEQWALDRGARMIEMEVVNVRTSLIAWYERRGYELTGETRPFPYSDMRFGVPRRADLEFVVLEKEIGANSR